MMGLVGAFTLVAIVFAGIFRISQFLMISTRLNFLNQGLISTRRLDSEIIYTCNTV